MSEYTHRNIIVPAAFQQLAQGLCEAAAEGDAGKGMFTTGLSPDGSAPATHYISSGYIADDLAELLPLTSVTPAEEPEGAPTVSTRPGQVSTVEAMAAQAGFDLAPGTIGALFDAIDVTDVYEVGPHERLAQLGLAIITEEAA